MNKTDYRHMRKLKLEYTEENAVLAAKAFDPIQSLKAFQKLKTHELAVIHHKELLSLLAQFGIHTKKDLERLLLDAAASGLVSAWD